MCIPTDQPYQTLTFESKGTTFQDVTRTADCRIVSVTPSNNEFTIRAVVTLKDYTFVRQRSTPDKGNLPGNIAPYLMEDLNKQSKSPKLVKLAAQLKSDTPATTIQNISKWLTTNIQYKYDPATWKYKQLDELLDRGYTECNGFSNLSTALCRNCGLPTRMAWGVCKSAAPIREHPAGTFISHNWNEVYLVGTGWVPFDVLDQTAKFSVVPKNHLRICPIGLGQADTVESLGFALHNFSQMTGGSSIPKYEAIP
ncbi:MAG: transglutaminase-like domain-containing protein [Gemmatales bacterium]